MILLRSNFNEVIETLCASERLVIIRLGNALIANLYIPCVSTSDRNILIILLSGAQSLRVICVLLAVIFITVPRRKKNLFKFWLN